MKTESFRKLLAADHLRLLNQTCNLEIGSISSTQSNSVMAWAFALMQQVHYDIVQTFGGFAMVSSGAFCALSHVDPAFGMAE